MEKGMAACVVLVMLAAGAWGEPQSVAVSSLELGNVSMTGHGYDGDSMKPGKNARGNPLSIGGKAFEDGFWMRAHAYLYIALDGNGTRFMAWTGVDDEVKGQEAAVQFRVLGDGRELWDSGVMKAGETAKRVEVDVTGVKTLVLAALPFSRNYAHNLADWAEAKIEFEGAAPHTFVPPHEEAYILTPKPGPAPRINPPRVYGARPGHPFIFTVPATGDRPMRFAAKGLPAGLKLDDANGIISGAAEVAGEYRVTLKASNASGEDTNTLKIVVGDALALTPPMGWNDWYSYSTEVSDAVVRGAAEAMYGSGMIQFGYAYVNIDDCWMVRPGADYNVLAEPGLYHNADGLRGTVKWLKLVEGTEDPAHGAPRDAEGKANANPRFPDMKGLTGYIHSLGLKAGIYTSPGPLTCAGYLGSFKHEELDAARFAEWGFDFLKYDWCSYGHVPPDLSREQLMAPFKVMNEALRKQPRDIVFNLCQYGMGDVWEWGAEVGGHCWRTTGDLGATMNDHSLYSNLITIGFGQNGLEKWAGPGRWNDPDYLLFGERFNLSPNEQYTYMTLWCLLSAPLVFSGQMDKLDDFTLNLLCNAEVIAVDQDPLGRQAAIVAHDDNGYVWAKDMEDGSKAVGLFNVGEYERELVVRWNDLGVSGARGVRDLWRQKDLGRHDGEFSATVPRHGVVMVKIGG